MGKEAELWNIFIAGGCRNMSINIAVFVYMGIGNSKFFHFVFQQMRQIKLKF